MDEIKTRLISFLAFPDFFQIDLPVKGNIDFKLMFDKILKKQKRNCPICGTFKDSLVVKRKDIYNIYWCAKDLVFFRDQDYEAPTLYSSNYFVEDYQKQYGKTYEQDKENINGLNLPRLKTILALTADKSYKKNLLEVGCALGFFLELAKQSGQFEVEGVEISEYAANFAKYKLELNVMQKDFLKTVFSHPVYDVIAMWYYLEHNKQMDDALVKIKEALKIGGILALSTPNANGITARKNHKEYAKIIPEDHYLEFSIPGITAMMKKHGLELVATRITGIHPGRWIKVKSKIINRILTWVMKKKKLGDTFEAYFKRIW
jgi:2-polyprenyl-3-methyl-5-hydroxy-6-metoxy-1,4-benzoquinol methylase